MNITLHRSLASLDCYCSGNEKQKLETAKLTLPDNISDNINIGDVDITKDNNESDTEFISHNSKKRPLNEIHNNEFYHGIKLKLYHLSSGWYKLCTSLA
nr:7310_t:CDS:2 [Entrophospora candida]